MNSRNGMRFVVELCVLGCAFAIAVHMDALYTPPAEWSGLLVVCLVFVLIAIVVFFNTNDEKLEQSFYQLMRRSVGSTLRAHQRIGELLGDAVKAKDSVFVAFLLKNYTYEPEVLLDCWKTAVVISDLGSMDALLRKSPPIVDVGVFGNGMTALIWAATAEVSNKDELVRWLLKHGADKTIFDDLGNIWIDYLSQVEINSLGLSREELDPFESPSEDSSRTRFREDSGAANTPTEESKGRATIFRHRSLEDTEDGYPPSPETSE